MASFTARVLESCLRKWIPFAIADQDQAAYQSFRGVQMIDIRSPRNRADDHQIPLFILSAGWRSGSTLLQRLLMSGRDNPALIWGEPYDHCGIVQRLADTTRAFTEKWPPESYFLHNRPRGELSHQWIANLYPSLSDLWQSHRAFLEHLFARPAERRDFVHWGIKEVRWGTPHARYLRWVFPKSKFIFVYRNPFDAYASYARMRKGWFYSWPDTPVLTPTVFGKLWKHLVNDFTENASEVGGLLVRYEELVSGKFELSTLENHLGFEVDRSVLEVRKPGTRRAPVAISGFERFLLARAVSPTARHLGYM